jgi:hypothetical protein
MRTLLLAAALFVSACQCGNPVTTDGGTGGSGGSSGGGTNGTGGSSGTGGSTGTGGSSGTGGGQSCGVNSVLCGGNCVITADDPANCGACNHACNSGDVCTSSTCVGSTSCPTGTTACMGRCVDLQSDSTFCGSCSASAACGPGRGCSQGSCVPTIALDAGAQACANGGPPVVVALDAGSVCVAALAPLSFRWALCSCGNATMSDFFYTDGFDSTQGPYDGGELGGGVGVNGSFNGSASFDIGGTAWIFGGNGLTSSSASNIRQEMHVNGQAQGGGSTVGSNAYVNGNISGFSIGGKLYVPAMGNVGAGVTVPPGNTVIGPVSVPKPCDCDPNQLIDVAGLVASGAANNDNAVVGLDPRVFDNAGGGKRLDLPCGRYYLTRVSPTGPITIAAHGRVALFIGGNLDASDDITITNVPNAEIDVFVLGSVNISANLALGATGFPAQFRMYIAGTSFSASSGALLAGNYYLPHASYDVSSGVDIYGSIFCGSFNASSSFRMHYDRGVLAAGSVCTGAVLDGGTTGGGCTDCRGCNNQACINGACGSCTSDSQCCAPLVCTNGTCGVPIIQ